VGTNKGMVQVSGQTYRIVERALLNEVVRLSDDRLVGMFRHEPVLEVVNCEIPPEALLEVARHARRMGRLNWHARRPRDETRWLRTLLAARSRVLRTLVLSPIERFACALVRSLSPQFSAGRAVDAQTACVRAIAVGNACAGERYPLAARNLQGDDPHGGLTCLHTEPTQPKK
jgi:hypothetical protein